MIDLVDRRYLGAIRFVDNVTKTGVSRPLVVTGMAGTVVLRNLSGLYVIAAAPMLEAHATVFAEPPDKPAIEKVEIALRVEDLEKKYLPRLCKVLLPRNPDPRHKDEEKSLFRPVDIPLYPAPSYSARGTWAALRISLNKKEIGIAAAYLEVTDDDGGKVLGSGISDPEGEVFMLLPGILPVRHSFGHGGDVLTFETSATLKVSWEEGRGWPPDPVALAERHVAHIVNTLPLKLKFAQTERVKIALT